MCEKVRKSLVALLCGMEVVLLGLLCARQAVLLPAQGAVVEAVVPLMLLLVVQAWPGQGALLALSSALPSGPLPLSALPS